MRSESSGLLDIRRMVEVYSRNKKGRTGNESAIPEPVTTGFGTPPGLVLPLPAPPDPDEIAHEQASRNRLMWALCGVAGMLGLGAVALAVVLVMGLDRRDSYAAMPQAATTPSTTQAQPPASHHDGEQAAPAAVDREEDDETSREAASTPEADSDSNDARDDERKARPAGDRAGERASRTRARRERRSRSRSRSRERDAEASRRNADDDEEQAAPTQSCLDEIGCALARSPPACCARYRSRRQDSSRLLDADDADPQPRSDVPRRLARADIAAGMREVRSSVAGCRAGTLATGTVTVSVEVGGDGRVESVRVKSAPADALGGCVARKVRRARFPRSQQGATFSYPFLFK